MNTVQWTVLFGLVALGSGVIGACAARWWARRQVAGLAAQLDRIDKARQTAAHQVAQARRQIERLQKDLAAQLKARADARAARRRDRDVPADAGERRKALERSLDDAEQQRPPLPAHEFADTLPMA